MSQRIVLNLEIIGLINDALQKMDHDPDEPLERVHGGFYVEIVQGRFHSVRPDRSYRLNEQPKRKKTA